MSRSWSKFRVLTFRERAILGVAMVLLPLLHLALRVFGFVRVCRMLERVRPLDDAPTTPPDEEQFTLAYSTARLVRVAASRGLYRANCLDQSVTLWSFLRLQGVETTIRIGVRRRPLLEAHAWVELDSIVVNDRSDVGQSFEAFSGSLFRIRPFD
jgi:hypothetical protein